MYAQYHEEFSNEVHQATASYLFWKTLQNKPANDHQLLTAMNETPLSWILISHTAMLNLIMTLGRIFDIDGNAISINALIKACIDNIQVFGKPALRERKIRMCNGTTGEWLDNYINNAYEPTKQDFEMLKSEIKKYRKIFQDIYQPLRHKIFAHKAKEYFGKTDELWEATKNSNIENLLDFINDLNITIRGAYDNGRKPILGNHKMDVDYFEKDFCSLLEKIKNA